MKILILFGLVALSQQCCLPDKYTGFMETVIGTSNGANPGTLNKMAGDLYIDGTRKMLVYIANGEVNGNPYSFKSIQNYNTKVMYTIDSNGKCTKSATVVNGMFDLTCFDNSMLKRSGYVGLPNDKKMIHVYEVPMAGGSFTSMSVDDNCVLVDILQTYGTSTQASRFSNVTIGVDPSVFTVPSSCNNL